jgi:hypothetical protein
MFCSKRTRYPALKDVCGTIFETESQSGLILPRQGLTHWLSNPSEPLSIDTTSRYSGCTKLLVQQAVDEQERIDWSKAFHGYLLDSHVCGLLEAPHEVSSNPSYNKTPTTQNASVISTLTTTKQAWNVQ